MVARRNGYVKGTDQGDVCHVANSILQPMKPLIHVNTNTQTVPTFDFPVGAAEVLRLCLSAHRRACVSTFGAVNLEQQV